MHTDDTIKHDTNALIKTMMESFQQSQSALIEKMFEKLEASQRDLVNSLYDPDARSRYSFQSSTPRQTELPMADENIQTPDIRPTSERTNMPPRPFAEELQVIENYERLRRPESSRLSNISSPLGISRSDPNHTPHLKLPTYEGKDEIDVFLTPFERLATRAGWHEQEKIDRMYQCLKGPAMRFLCTLPQEVCTNYSALKGSLINRFGRREPPTTIRRELTEIMQGSASNEEFAEEIRRLVTRAYPGVGLDMKDQLAAEAFLKGYRNSRIAYEVLNKNPSTLNEALNLATFLEHNYKATLGREEKEKTRRVSWQDQEENVDLAGNINRLNYMPSYTTIAELDKRLKKIEATLQRIDQQEQRVVEERSPSPSAQKANRHCYTCGREGHFARECRDRSRSPSPNREFQNRPRPPTLNRLMLGRKVFQPQDLSFKQRDTLRNPSQPMDYVVDPEKDINTTKVLARRDLKAAQEHQKGLHDINVLGKQYQAGDLVYILNTSRKKWRRPKLQSVQNGPYVVARVHGPFVYEVQNNHVKKTLHHNKLKPYTAEFIPSWVNRIIERVAGRATPNSSAINESVRSQTHYSRDVRRGSDL